MVKKKKKKRNKSKMCNIKSAKQEDVQKTIGCAQNSVLGLNK